MSNTDDQNDFDDSFPSYVRCSVSEQNQFQLPATLVREIGFQSNRVEIADGAKVAWYYHEAEDKAVLASDAVDRPSLELVDVCRVTGVSNDALATGTASGGRVTILSALPDSVYEPLTRGPIVLKPVYSGRHSELETTYVTVYPAQEFDDGKLPNVDEELRESEYDDGSVRLQSIQKHANSI